MFIHSVGVWVRLCRFGARNTTDSENHGCSHFVLRDWVGDNRPGSSWNDVDVNPVGNHHGRDQLIVADGGDSATGWNTAESVDRRGCIVVGYFDSDCMVRYSSAACHTIVACTS